MSEEKPYCVGTTECRMSKPNKMKCGHCGKTINMEGNGPPYLIITRTIDWSPKRSENNMPCMGPTGNQENAEKAFQDVLQLFKEKYGVHCDANISEELQTEINKLRTTILKVFQLDSFDNW